jgi:hypothetical protein
MSGFVRFLAAEFRTPSHILTFKHYASVPGRLAVRFLPWLEHVEMSRMDNTIPL